MEACDEFLCWYLISQVWPNLTELIFKYFIMKCAEKYSSFRPIWSRISIYSCFRCANGNNCHISRAIRACIHLNSSQQKILFQNLFWPVLEKWIITKLFDCNFFHKSSKKLCKKKTKCENLMENVFPNFQPKKVVKIECKKYGKMQWISVKIAKKKKRRFFKNYWQVLLLLKCILMLEKKMLKKLSSRMAFWESFQQTIDGYHFSLRLTFQASKSRDDYKYFISGDLVTWQVLWGIVYRFCYPVDKTKYFIQTTEYFWRSFSLFQSKSLYIKVTSLMIAPETTHNRHIL